MEGSETKVSRLKLGNQEFEGDNSSYLLKGDGETVLVDTGVSTPETKGDFVERLGENDVEVTDIDDVFLTHWHADHVGLAGYVQEKSNAPVWVHENDAPLVAQEDKAWESMYDRQRSLFEDWGVPDEPRSELVAFIEAAEAVYGEPPSVDTFEDGRRFEVAGVELEAIEAPGHTSGLTCFAAGGTVFTGDAVLPVYTPNVGGADVRVEKPLEKYLETLVRIAERDFDRAYPGHRDTIEEPTERAHEILRHHHDRAERIIELLREEGPLDAWEVGACLFGELENIHILHGPGESYAHLEHMERAGVVSSFRDGTVKYRLENPDVVGEAFPNEPVPWE